MEGRRGSYLASSARPGLSSAEYSTSVSDSETSACTSNGCDAHTTDSCQKQGPRRDETGTKP
eukprot:3181172-Rhodomonas_salina.3